MDGQKIYPFYSSFPIGAAALLSPLKPKAWLAGRASDLAGWAAGLAGWASGLTGWPRERDVWMHVLMENLPILQDFVPYWGHCPASPRKNQAKKSRAREPLII